ncbi:hypothetical protein EYF80_030868 [Liparis tanakae]|uniref:Uncharacterized protein n=1 Tax=Liparis tanakae TaxID=230148 RepID=A0A4Z2H0T2_9TELE|nr:hypothetical protein EYF80_030868 [Liparis tanakae]
MGTEVASRLIAAASAAAAAAGFGASTLTLKQKRDSHLTIYNDRRLLGAELTFRRSSWMLLASLMREGWRVKPRLAPGDENSFLAQLSTDARDSRTLFLAATHSDVKLSRILAATSRLTTRGSDTRKSMTNFWLITLRDLSFRLLTEA